MKTLHFLLGAAFLVRFSLARAQDKTITVSQDGTANFKTVQEATASVPDNSASRTVIRIHAGTYKGPFEINLTKANITLAGDGAANTILTWDRNVYDPVPAGADKFDPGLHVAADGFNAQDITIQNTSGDHGQALAVRVDADHAVFKNCRFLGWQDTLMVNTGRQYFQKCYIEGRVDFIYGDGTAAFDHCEIHSKNGGYVTAASTAQDHPFGLVFFSCKLTGDKTPWVDPAGTNTPRPSHNPGMAFLGRPWREYASVAYLNCEMDDHIMPVGWFNWNKPPYEKTARYSEYNSSGPGANPSQRVPWSRQLTKDEADKISIDSVLGGKDNWAPDKMN